MVSGGHCLGCSLWLEEKGDWIIIHTGYDS
ncbi:hypothetical protein GF319_05980 [Candidatus Bathyarchaeota archaeon]|nr:hypothetical protein [Candidatus Bathyarchaeota archaeon]